MRDLSQIIRKSLSKKFLGKQSVGAVAQSIVHKLYPHYAKDMLVYIQATMMCIKPANHRDKVFLFREKDRIINAVNQGLEKVGYNQKVTKIIFK